MERVDMWEELFQKFENDELITTCATGDSETAWKLRAIKGLQARLRLKELEAALEHIAEHFDDQDAPCEGQPCNEYLVNYAARALIGDGSTNTDNVSPM